MTTDITITTRADGKIAIATPYSADFVRRIKAAGARWDSGARVWTLPAADIDIAREVLRASFGRDDTPDGNADLVRVRVTVLYDLGEFNAPYQMFGRCIARATGRDSGATLGPGVSFVSGAPKSGGSVKNWKTVIPAGSVFVLRDIPRALVADASCEDYRVDILEDDSTTRRATLLARREALTAELARVDAELARD